MRAGGYPLAPVGAQTHNLDMTVTRLAPNCRPTPSTDDPTHECTGCPCVCHPEHVRVSHGAPIEDHAATETRASVIRAAAGLPARRRYTRAA